MSVLTVQVGQCGNQLGAALFTTLAREAQAGNADLLTTTQWTFFRERGARSNSTGATHHARAVLVDMEPKVVQACVAHPRASLSGSPNGPGSLGGGPAWWRYDSACGLCGEGGSGNNWAMGYARHGPAACEAACDGPIRRELEAMDHVGGVLLLQSMAGGTGAGLGARLAEEIRDRHPSVFLLSQSVWPHVGGDVTVQAYNTTLTLGHLVEACDGVIVTGNERLHRACVRLFDVKRPTLQDMNAVAARDMAGLLLPARHARSDGRGARLRLLGDVVEHVCCHPGLPLLSLVSHPMMPPSTAEFEQYRWTATMRGLHAAVKSAAAAEAGDASPFDPAPASQLRALASLAVLRGDGAGEVSAEAVGEMMPHSTANPRPVCAAWHPSRFCGYGMSATLLSNCSMVAGTARRMVDRAYMMMDSRAYLHQYEGCGVGKQDLEEVLLRVEEVATRYDMLAVR
ncbi:unnamed protein product [Pedinophyceae sp. YPF-701]|nr:unnamed protein product [Pedinophyceae sp. YPF-701]